MKNHMISTKMVEFNKHKIDQIIGFHEEIIILKMIYLHLSASLEFYRSGNNLIQTFITNTRNER